MATGPEITLIPKSFGQKSFGQLNFGQKSFGQYFRNFGQIRSKNSVKIVFDRIFSVMLMPIILVLYLQNHFQNLTWAA